jgi:hypothetical protein
MILSVIATLISSVALIGVAVGLSLQARQLRVSQIQAVRSLHTELIKIAMENPSLGTVFESDVDPADAPKAAFINLLMTLLQASYSLKVASKATVSLQAERIFAAEFSRSWWEYARDSYMVETSMKREQEFVALIDEKFQEAMRNHGGSPSG